MLQGPKDFDKEESHIQATHQQISIWADTAQLPLDALPGMGIRARWRQVQGQGNSLIDRLPLAKLALTCSKFLPLGRLRVIC